MRVCAVVAGSRAVEFVTPNTFTGRREPLTPILHPLVFEVRLAYILPEGTAATQAAHGTVVTPYDCPQLDQRR